MFKEITDSEWRTKYNNQRVVHNLKPTKLYTYHTILIHKEIKKVLKRNNWLTYQTDNFNHTHKKLCDAMEYTNIPTHYKDHMLGAVYFDILEIYNNGTKKENTKGCEQYTTGIMSFPYSSVNTIKEWSYQLGSFWEVYILNPSLVRDKTTSCMGIFITPQWNSRQYGNEAVAAINFEFNQRGLEDLFYIPEREIPEDD